MPRHSLALSALIAPVLVIAILVVCAVIALTRNAQGQECRFAYQCPYPLVERALTYAPVQIRHQHRREVRRHYQKGTRIVTPATSKELSKPPKLWADDTDENGMPLVWPILEDEGQPIAATLVPTTKEIPVAVKAPLPAPIPKQDDVSWLHTENGKVALITAFLLLIIVTVVGILPQHVLRGLRS